MGERGLDMYLIAKLGIWVFAMLAFAAVFIVTLAVSLVVHPVRTLVMIVGKVAALAAGIALLLALLTWFAYDHSKPDFLPVFVGLIATIIVGAILHTICQWFLEGSTREERTAVQEYASAPTPSPAQSPAHPSMLHRDVINGLIDPTPWPIRWWCEDGGRLWTAYVALGEGEDPCGIGYSPGDIVIRHHRDEQGGVRLWGGSYVRHKQGLDPKDEIAENIAMFSGVNGYPVLTCPVVYAAASYDNQ